MTHPTRDLLYFVAPRRVEVRRAEMPQAGAGEALVQTIVSAVSPGTELLFYRGEAPGGMAVDANLPALGGAITYPLRYGYACVGRVTQVGPGVGEEWRGRTVFAFQPHASAFAAPVTDLLPVPEGVAPEAAAFLPNMETAVNFVMDGRPVIGERVAVVGLGVVGLLTTALLARFPLAELTAVDPLPQRRALALSLGAHRATAPDAPDATATFDLVYEVSGAPAALNTALALAGYAGRVVVGSWYGAKQAPIDLGGAFHRSRIRLLSSQVSTLDPRWLGRWDKARRLDVAWAMLRDLPAELVITHTLPVTDAPAAYRLLSEHPEQAIQVIFDYTDTHD